MQLPTKALPQWEYLHPMAYICFLCTISPEMFEIMSTLVTCRILIYVDEVNPGNPLHPDPLRKLQAIYWAICEWPQWLLQRKDAWPCFGVLRSCVCDDLPGGLSQLMKLVLRTFFASTGHNFQRGCVVQHGSGQHLFTATFAGFMTDEAALKEVFDIKGQAGKFPCFTCWVAYKRARHTGGRTVATICSTLTQKWLQVR